MGREAVVRSTRTDALSRPETSAGRLVVPDVLRGVAIVAMLVAHASAFVPDKPAVAAFATSMLSEVASPLFALVMGISAQLVWSRSPKVGVTLLQQAIRGVFLIVLGVWMATWGSWVAIVLAHLGLLLIVGVPILLARTRWVLTVAAAVLLVSEPLVRLIQGWATSAAISSPTSDVWEWAATSPHYRLLNLLPFFLVGAVLMRHGFRRDTTLWSLALIAPLAYLTWGAAEYFDIVRSRSGDYVDTLRDIGLVFAVYVIVVIAATVRREGAKRFWQPIFVPLIACGQVALSLYLLHVGLIALWARNFGRPTENFWPGWLVIVPGMILVGWLWWWFVGTGPVEWVMGWLTGRRKPLLRRRRR